MGARIQIADKSSYPRYDSKSLVFCYFSGYLPKEQMTVKAKVSVKVKEFEIEAKILHVLNGKL